MMPITNKPADQQPSPKSGGLPILLKVAAILFLFPIPLFFVWIAGIVWFLLFRKKMDAEPDKQKKYTFRIFAASIFSFICFACMIASNILAPNSLFLSPSMDEQTLSINSDYIIYLQYEPDYATLSNVTYTIDDRSLASITTDPDHPSILTLHTKGEGSINITANTGTVESNVLSYDIIDYDRIAQEQAAAEQRRLEEIKAAEEQRIKEEAEAKAAEEQRLREEAEAKAAEEQRLREEAEAKAAEEQRLREEAEAKAAEEQRLREEAEHQALAAISSSSESETNSNGNNFNTYNNSEQQKTESTYVLNTSTHKIHYPTCSSVSKIAPHNYATSNETLDELKASGYTTCGKCF